MWRGEGGKKQEEIKKRGVKGKKGGKEGSKMKILI